MERNIDLENLAAASQCSGIVYSSVWIRFVSITQYVCLQKSVRRRLLEHCADLLSSLFYINNVRKVKVRASCRRNVFQIGFERHRSVSLVMFMDADLRGTWEFLLCRQVFYMFLNSGICDSVNSHMFIRGQVAAGRAKALSIGTSRGRSSVGTHGFSWI